MASPEQFAAECESEIAKQGSSKELKQLSRSWMDEATRTKYSYHFEWMGLPVIQYPQDILALQEIVWKTNPDLVIETGVARGGSLIFYASLLELIGNGSVLGIDIDIRAHNRAAIEAHPMYKRISLLQGSSIDTGIVEQVRKLSAGKKVMVVLDSNHTHEHVLAELEAYAPLVSVGCYCVVLDTVVEDLPAEFSSGRPWAPGDNPKTAVWDFLRDHPEFSIDQRVENKVMITVAPDGYLKRLR